MGKANRWTGNRLDRRSVRCAVLQALRQPARGALRAALRQRRPSRSACAHGAPMFGPQTVQMTEQVIPRYEAIAARGGWPLVQPAGPLQNGMRHPAIAALRHRLIVEGDLDQGHGVTDVFDAAVESAVRSFQIRHGIGSEGVVREQTYAALNVPAHIRAGQLRTNLVRLRTMGGNLGPRYVLCNIPATQIEIVENGFAPAHFAAVVGKPDRPSPDIQSRIVEVNFNPFWTVPASIVRRDLIPKMQAEPDYLTKNRIRILDGNGHELSPAQINWYSTEATNYRFKQDPGDFNSLGSIRINFPSAHGVYMHDTPFKNLFGDDFRFHSSGCVRVQNVRELVNWLLAETPSWSPGRSTTPSARASSAARASLGRCRSIGSMSRPGSPTASCSSATTSTIATAPAVRMPVTRGADSMTAAPARSAVRVHRDRKRGEGRRARRSDRHRSDRDGAGARRPRRPPETRAGEAQCAAGDTFQKLDIAAPQCKTANTWRFAADMLIAAANPPSFRKRRSAAIGPADFRSIECQHRPFDAILIRNRFSRHRSRKAIRKSRR